VFGGKSNLSLYSWDNHYYYMRFHILHSALVAWGASIMLVRLMTFWRSLPISRIIFVGRELLDPVLILRQVFIHLFHQGFARDRLAQEGIDMDELVCGE
jgi:hypothetical protein